MSTEYKLWLHDDFNWDYAGFGGKETIDKQVREIAPHAERIANFYKWLIYDIGKTWPPDFQGKVLCDDMLYTADGGVQTLPSAVLPDKMIDD